MKKAFNLSSMILLLILSTSYGSPIIIGEHIQLTNNQWNEACPMVSPNGRLIVSHGNQGDHLPPYNINIFNLNNKFSNQLTSTQYNQTPSFSRDGQTIFYSTSESENANDWNLCKMNLDGTDKTILTHGNPFKAMVSELLDGRILYQTWVPTWSISIMNADGSDVHSLNTSTDVQQPRVSADSKYVVYGKQDSGGTFFGNMYLYNLETDLETQLTFDSANHGFASFSPDGKWIVYQSKEDSGPYFNLWALNLETMIRQQLTFEDFDQMYPTFLPDSSGIIYVSNEDGGAYYDIWELKLIPEPTTLSLLGLGLLALRRKK